MANILSGKNKANVASIATSFPSWTHPDVLYYENDWKMIRDTYEGERAVKREGQLYLPSMASMDSAQYSLFLENATFFNMVARTVGALTGTIFNKNPVITGLPKELDNGLKSITKKGQSLRAFTQNVTREVIEMGRAGVLIDTVNDGSPYVVMFTAEAILDWDSIVINGREQLSRVVLLELKKKEKDDLNNTGITSQYAPLIRVLTLENGVYMQEIYNSVKEDATFPDINGTPDRVVTPTKNGTPLDRIPFYIIGPTAGAWDMQKSPILDIVRMNISHYRSYAQLEHGRYYTGFPVFWASKSSADQTSDYRIGPDSVWELPPGEKAGLMEFNGQGLKFLENAIVSKQGHVASLGGRLMGIETQATSETDNQSTMKDRNEQALLFELSQSLDDAFTSILQMWAEWTRLSRTDAEKIEMEFNKSFMLKDASAREFRAVQSMWKDGLLPLDVVFDYFKKAEVIPDWMDLKEFSALLNSEASFPNNPDIAAKKAGFPNAGAKKKSEDAEKDRKFEAAEAEKAAKRKKQEDAANRRVELERAKTELDPKLPKIDKDGLQLRNFQQNRNS